MGTETYCYCPKDDDDEVDLIGIIASKIGPRSRIKFVYESQLFREIIYTINGICVVITNGDTISFNSRRKRTIERILGVKL